MNQFQIAGAALAVACPCALADPVFFDDFDGTELKPWWELGDPPMEYTVGGGLLTVTKVFQQSGEGIYANAMGADVQIQGDFDVTWRMGWTPGSDRILSFIVVSPDSKLIAECGYRELNESKPMVFAHTNFNLKKVQAPPPGLHEISFARRGQMVSFLLDGEPLADLPEMTGFPIGNVYVWFVGPKSNMGPLQVDQVSVTPGPGTATGLFGILLQFGARRRTRARTHAPAGPS